MVVSSDDDYGSDPGVQSPENPDIRSSMAKAALFSLDRSRRAQVEVRGLPMPSQVLSESLHRRGAKKMAREIEESLIMSGKRTRTATATFVAAPAEKLKRELRGIVLHRLRFTKTWW